MCGFLGEYSFQKNQITNKELFSSLLELSNHRGPDSTKSLREENFQLGFNRLAILDVSENGNQPKTSPSGRYFVVFNGEVYNFKELQKKYELKDLKSSSDTEVIIHLFDKLGIENTIKSLNGMFAIAVIDSQENTLTLTRDFAGIKPFFYGKSKRGIVFASQFDQIFKHPWFNANLILRQEIIKEYFGFGYMQAPNTVYEDVFQVQPGEILVFSEKGDVLKKTNILFPKEYINGIKDVAQYSYNQVLEKVVSDQLISDVPIATFLSGGIDSPLITAVAKNKKQDIEAFTFGIDHPKYDESEKAKEYAKHLNVAHTIKKVKEEELLNQIEEHFKYYPEPFGDYSSIPTYVITNLARKTHTVMLSGDGGDELFFGYPRMLDVLNKKHWFKIPFAIRKPLIKILNKLNVINTWAPYSYKTLEEWIIAKQLQITPNVLDTFVPKTLFSSEMNALFDLPKVTSKKKMLYWLRWNEFYGHMQRVLIKVDRASMGNSLEVRVPLLDKKSINFAWYHAPVNLDNHSQLKQVLKESLSTFLPKELIEKKKKGFDVPIEHWLRNELKDDLKQYIFNKPFYGEDFINVASVKEYVSNFLNEKHNNSWGVWHIYAWQKWYYGHVYSSLK
ncbi:MAG: asparagine synthase (glutamine-hydrolyzing) [Flavobacteriaceae bacterium]|nr:asparagine synthase (glutamine-hydrolyzing) [Flavobacteriaceae bacterium]